MDNVTYKTSFLHCKRMKTFILFLSFFCLTSVCYAQKELLSYEDMKYLIEHNLDKADAFMEAKGYVITKSNKKKATRSYKIALKGGTINEISVRADGRKIFIEIETNEVSQYNMIYNSISQFLVASGDIADIQTYNVKELGQIYIMIKDPVPYNPIRKDYDIHVVADKNIVSLN